MEHNEYALWTVKIKVQHKERKWVQQDETQLTGRVIPSEHLLTMVAPKGELGRALLAVHFAESTGWKFGDFDPFEDGKKVKILEMTETKLDGIIRYDDAYRGRM